MVLCLGKEYKEKSENGCSLMYIKQDIAWTHLLF